MVWDKSDERADFGGLTYDESRKASTIYDNGPFNVGVWLHKGMGGKFARVIVFGPFDRTRHVKSYKIKSGDTGLWPWRVSQEERLRRAIFKAAAYADDLKSKYVKAKANGLEIMSECTAHLQAMQEVDKLLESVQS